MKFELEDDLMFQRKELFKYLFEISNYAHESELVLRNEDAFSEVLQNVTKMKIVAEKLVNLLNENFHLKESEELSNGVNILYPNDCEKDFPKSTDNLVLDIKNEDIEFNQEEKATIQIKSDDQVDLKRDTSAMKFNCDYCTLGTNRFVSMKRHMKDKHNLVYKDFLKSHNALYALKCEFCDETFKKKVHISKHVEKYHPENWEEYEVKYKVNQCDQCTSSFFTNKGLKSHRRTVHKLIEDEISTQGKSKNNTPDQLPYNAKRRCKYCPKILSNLSVFTDHILVHEMGDKPFTCDQCKFRSNRRCALKTHKKEHIVTTLLCKNCGIITNSHYELRTHMKKVHKEKYYTSGPKPGKKLESDLICDLCAKSFKTKKTLKNHMQVHQKEEDKPVCDICGQKYADKQHLRLHRLLHFPPTFKCDECEEIFHTPKYRTRHKAEVHTHERLYNCEQCGKGFNNKHAYEGHMNMHLGLKPYKCHFCDMAYQNTSNRMAHEKRIHKESYVGRARFVKCKK